ncbi:MAG TPA: cupin domain-containing protein, partial [Candidatus Ozemobacteraceae bacterium]|nr:cupin domain-containing protein [Candidatus Ozemobacteraceae bacterium]
MKPANKTAKQDPDSVLTPQDIIDRLGLKPHPEGGYYAETWRSSEFIAQQHLAPRYSGNRRFGTAIYYFLTSDTFSALHRIESDEIFHFYAGYTVELFQLTETGVGAVHRLGNDLCAGALPQLVVPRGIWQGCRLVQSGSWALLGCTVAPGFEYDDFCLADRHELLERFPQWRD